MKIFDKIKMKAKAVTMQPKVMKRLPKYLGIDPDELRNMLIQKCKAIKTLQEEDALTDDLLDEFYIDQATISIVYAIKPSGENPDPKIIEDFVKECAAEGGFTEDEIKQMEV